ncbi:50S ribosomal protein L15 [bacterium]|nr:MAG: 50S ribosomal protein L15 [bacterium]
MRLRLEELKPAPGSTKKRKRVGRGEATGHGKTSGRGHKGALSRSGHKRKPYFEGGQMPIYRRIPKKGFTSKNHIRYSIVNVKDLNKFSEQEKVTPELLASRGLTRGRMPVKVLGEGEIRVALTVSAHSFSSTAKQKIEAAGGRVEII